MHWECFSWPVGWRVVWAAYFLNGPGRNPRLSPARTLLTSVPSELRLRQPHRQAIQQGFLVGLDVRQPRPPLWIDISMAGRTTTATAAFRQDAGHEVIGSGLHDGATDSAFHHVLLAVVLDENNLRHCQLPLTGGLHAHPKKSNHRRFYQRLR